MLPCYSDQRDQPAVVIYPVLPHELDSFLTGHDPFMQQWVKTTGFQTSKEEVCLVPNQQGYLHCVVVKIKEKEDLLIFSTLPLRLPPGVYQLYSSAFSSTHGFFKAAFFWGLGAYQFTHYCEARPVAQLSLPDFLLKKEQEQPNKTNPSFFLLTDWMETIYQAYDWINLPANVMTPDFLAKTVSIVARACGASVQVKVGQELLEQNYPAIHAVGRASAYEPRLIEMNWNEQLTSYPLLVLVGKGVCFDTGGLDLKPALPMRLMKKDMAGAAHALALARMIMKSNLPVRLRLLIPAVENSVNANSYRPGDVLQTRSGLTVEIENTDAEGRLVLCDALTDASEGNPNLLIDFASLTGAARVALGAEIPAFYCNEEKLAQQLLRCSKQQGEVIWQMPLYQPYSRYLESNVADCVNAAATESAGSITAALFLQKFVPKTLPWIHFDLSGWNYEGTHGRFKGAEMVALRSVFALLEERYAQSS